MRITPADAGKTKPTDGHILRKQDHPRRCGENSLFTQLCAEVGGSPPRMRGKQQQVRRNVIRRRITPADAGKTYPYQTKGSERWDHPRGCGENTYSIGIPGFVQGSPPRMRGKPVLLKFSVPLSGITPAGAGKTIEGRRQNIYVQDHPRRCGENPLRRSAPRRARGSPPQVRGKPADMAASPQVTRITPAGAGKTRC